MYINHIIKLDLNALFSNSTTRFTILKQLFQFVNELKQPLKHSYFQWKTFYNLQTS